MRVGKREPGGQLMPVEMSEYVDLSHECIEWDRYLNKMFYGQVRRDGKLWLVHRLVWVEENGPIPDGLCVLHRCDNPPCINIEHLFLGTRPDNTNDMMAKGRQRNGYRKISESQRYEIRRRRERGESLPVIARAVGVSLDSVWRISRAR